MNVNYESVVGLTIFLSLGYYLQTGPKIGDFLPPSSVDQFGEDGIVVVSDLFTGEELETITTELMLRVNKRAAGVRAEDLLNLHFNDSFILSRRRQSRALLPVYLQAWLVTPTFSLLPLSSSIIPS